LQFGREMILRSKQTQLVNFLILISSVLYFVVRTLAYVNTLRNLTSRLNLLEVKIVLWAYGKTL